MAGTGKRYTEGQIIAILTEAEAAPAVDHVIRRRGVTQKTYYWWKTKVTGMDVSEARRLRALEEENHRSKLIVADQTRDNQILKEARAV